MTTLAYPLDQLLALRDRRRPATPARKAPSRVRTPQARAPRVRPRATSVPRPPAPFQAGRVGSPKRRCIGVLVLFALLFGYLGYTMVDLQLLSPDRYVAQAQAQRVRAQELAAPRGRILDRNGDELALSVPQRTLFTDPRTVVDPVGTARTLAPVLGIDESALLDKLVADNSFGYLSRQMPDEVADRVEAMMANSELPLQGVYLLEEPRRFLPSGDLARGILGRTDIDNVGIGGVESMFDDVLTGEPGRLEVERAPGGRTIATGNRVLTPAVPGGDVQLTIDQAIQYEAERALSEQVQELQAAGGMVVLSVPSTGEILAMASITRDPETGETAVSGNNMALTTVFEPGSVMKAVTMAGAIEDGLVQPDTMIEVPDSLRVGDHTFTEYKPHGLGEWTVTDIMRKSSNTGTIKLAQMLGPERLESYFRGFGLGERTGIGFPNEAAGVVHPADDWSITSIGSMPIGQGISATPVQMLAVYNTIANGGVHLPLRLIEGHTDDRGVLQRAEQDGARQVISASTAGSLREMLAEVVMDGTGTRAQVPGYTAAGKTGTALKPHGGGYVGPDGIVHYMGSFVGFAPVADPAISMIVVIDDPRNGLYTGGLVAAPVFSELSQFALRRLQVPATAETAATEGEEDATPAQKVRAVAATSPEEPVQLESAHVAASAGTER